MDKTMLLKKKLLQGIDFIFTDFKITFIHLHLFDLYPASHEGTGKPFSKTLDSFLR